MGARVWLGSQMRLRSPRIAVCRTMFVFAPAGTHPATGHEVPMLLNLVRMALVWRRSPWRLVPVGGDEAPIKEISLAPHSVITVGRDRACTVRLNDSRIS